MKAKNAFFLAIGIILLIASFIVMGVLYFKLKKLSVDSLIVTENTEQTQPTESEPIKPIEPEIRARVDFMPSKKNIRYPPIARKIKNIFNL